MMYAVRVDMKNGLHLEYYYSELDRAKQCLEVAETALFNGDKCGVFDDGGREAKLDGASIQAVQLVDIAMETEAVVRLGLLVRGIHRRIDPSVQEPMQQHSVRSISDIAAPMPEQGRGAAIFST